MLRIQKHSSAESAELSALYASVNMQAFLALISSAVLVSTLEQLVKSMPYTFEDRSGSCKPRLVSSLLQEPFASAKV